MATAVIGRVKRGSSKSDEMKCDTFNKDVYVVNED